MAYNPRYNPDALPAHAEPEQAAQMFSSRDDPAPRRDNRSSRDSKSSRSDSYATRPPPPTPAQIQTSRRNNDDYRGDSRASGGYASPTVREGRRDGNYDQDRRQASGGQRTSSYEYDDRAPPPRQSAGYPSEPRRPESTSLAYRERDPEPRRGGRDAVAAVPSTRAGNSDDIELRRLFDNVDTERTGHLSERGLGRALVNGDFTAFDTHTVRMMIRMFDVDKSGTIDFREFCGLWGFLGQWHKLFEKFDVDRSGAISLDEFKTAITEFGYSLSDDYIRLLFRVHDVRRQGALSFDLFVQSCISLKRMTDVFKKYDTDRDGYITLSFEQFLVGTQDLFQINSISAATDTGIY